MGDIGAAAIYGAIGGGLGVLIGTLFAMPFKETRFAQIATTVLTVAFVVLGINFAEPVLKPYIGEYLPSSSATNEFDSEFEAAFATMSEDPIFAAILAREPALRNELRSDLQEVVNDAASPVAAQSMAFSASYNKVLSKLLYYAKRATDEDLVAFNNAVTNGLEVLSDRDPRFCYDYLYNPTGIATMSVPEIREKFGGEPYDQQQKVGGRMVTNAYDDIPDYDVNAGAQGVDRASAKFQSMLPGELIGLVTGAKRPANDEEAKLACDATAVLYRALLAEEQAADALRHLFLRS